MPTKKQSKTYQYRVEFYYTQAVQPDGNVFIFKELIKAKTPAEAKAKLIEIESPSVITITLVKADNRKVTRGFEFQPVERFVGIPEEEVVPTTGELTVTVTNTAATAAGTVCISGTVGPITHNLPSWSSMTTTPFIGAIGPRPVEPCKFHPNAIILKDGRCTALDHDDTTYPVDEVAINPRPVETPKTAEIKEPEVVWTPLGTLTDVVMELPNETVVTLPGPVAAFYSGTTEIPSAVPTCPPPEPVVETAAEELVDELGGRSLHDLYRDDAAYGIHGAPYTPSKSLRPLWIIAAAMLVIGLPAAVFLIRELLHLIIKH